MREKPERTAAIGGPLFLRRVRPPAITAVCVSELSMAFSSGESRKGQSSRRPKSGSGLPRKLLYATVALCTGSAVVVWLVATAATVHSVAKAGSPADQVRPSVAVVTRPQPLSDPRVLVIPRAQLAETDSLSAEAIKAHWSRTSGATPGEHTTEMAQLDLPPAVTASGMPGVAFGKPLRPTWAELNAAKQAGRLDILRRAIAATGTDAGRTERLAFAAPADADALKVVATLGTALPAPEAAIEIAFVGDLLGPSAAVAEVEPDGLTTGAVPPAAEVASLENPFEEVLATPDAASDAVPLPVARPAQAGIPAQARVPAEAAIPARAAIPAPEATIPMRAKREPEPKEAPKTLLAYARPQNPLDTDDSPSIFGKRSTLPGRARGIAVYDISAGVVHMPSGEKLKAHSGRGEYRDNPKFVHVKNRGATPPNVYSLRMREARFHGIEAIRMTPVGDAKMYGRDGFLTHTYLLRRRGDSSGCVVFEDYNRFLNAFKRGEVKTIVVVPHIGELGKYMAML